MLLTSCCERFIIRSQASRTWRIRLVVQDAALSRRRSRVRLPYALPNTHFEPSQARSEAAWEVSVFGVSPSVQQQYSNALREYSLIRESRQTSGRVDTIG